MASTISERWLFARRGYMPWLAVLGLLFQMLAVATLAAGGIWPRSHFAIIELPNIEALLLLPGAAAAFGVLILMVIYLARYDTNPLPIRRRWIPWFIVGGTLTAGVYCLTAYRLRSRRARPAGLRRRPWGQDQTPI